MIEMIEIAKAWIETAKACIAAFMKARNSLVVWCSEKQKQKMVKIYFLKLLLKMFGYNQKGVYGRPSRKGNYMLHYYVILLKVD